jgi:hypothetical protein
MKGVIHHPGGCGARATARHGQSQLDPKKKGERDRHRWKGETKKTACVPINHYRNFERMRVFFNSADDIDVCLEQTAVRPPQMGEPLLLHIRAFYFWTHQLSRLRRNRSTFFKKTNGTTTVASTGLNASEEKWPTIYHF